MFNKKIFISAYIILIGISLLAMYEDRFLPLILLGGFVLIIDRITHLRHMTGRILNNKSVGNVNIKDYTHTQLQRLNRRMDLQDKQIKEAELRLYKQLEARDILRDYLDHDQFRSIGGLRSWAISPDTALLLYQLIGDKQNVCIVEAGSGVSSIVFGSALKNNNIKGHVYSLEHEVKYVIKTRQKIKSAGVDEWVSVVDAPLRSATINSDDYLWFDRKSLDKLPSDNIDILFVDSPPGNVQPLSRYPALPILYERLSDDAVVVLDDYNRTDEKNVVDMWMSQFTDFDFEVIHSDHGTAILRRKK